MRMRYFLLLVYLILFGSNIFSQRVEKWFDYTWKEIQNPEIACFYSVSIKTDSGWNQSDFYVRQKQIQMQGLFEDSAGKIKNGTFYYFHPNGKLESIGKYVYGKKEGTWLNFYDNGNIEDSTVYKNGHRIGKSLKWFEDGSPEDSIITSENGDEVFVSWFQNGNVNSKGRKIWDKKDGNWCYYNDSGIMSEKEVWNSGHIIYDTLYDSVGAPIIPVMIKRDGLAFNKLMQKMKYSKNGNLVSDTLYYDNSPNNILPRSRDIPALYPGGPMAFHAYLSNQLYFPIGLKIVNADSINDVVKFKINTDDHVSDISVVVPFYPQFDDIVVSVIKHNKTKWIPARNHNRKVPFYYTQQVFFRQRQD